MDIKLTKEALELCIKTIKILHPVLNPEEPCIAFESVELAQQALDSISKGEMQEIQKEMRELKNIEIK